MKSTGKCVLLLILMMILNMIPISVQAGSTNGLSKVAIKVPKDHVFYDKTTANVLKINFKDNDGEDEEFYLELDNAKWNDEALTIAFGQPRIEDGDYVWEYDSDGGNLYTRARVTYTKQSDECMKVYVEGKTISEKARYSFPLLVEVTGANAIVNLKGGTTITKGTWTFATSVDKKAYWSTGTIDIIGTSGELAELRILENYKGAMSEGETRFTIELENPEYNFDISGESVITEYDKEGYKTYKISDKDSIEFLSGFYNKASYIYMLVNEKNKGLIEVIIPSIEGNATEGTVCIKNLHVKTKELMPTEGNLTIKISSDDLSNIQDSITMAKIENYGTFIEMMPTNAVQIPAGHIKDIEFTMGEKVDGSLVGNRMLTLKLDTAKFDYRTLLAKYGETEKTEAEISKMEDEDVLKLDPELDLEKLKKDRCIQLVNNTTLIKALAFELDKDGNIDPSALVITTAKGIESNNKIDRVRVKLPVYVPIASRKLGKSSLTIDGPAAEGPISVQVVEIKNPIRVTLDNISLKSGVKDQEGGKITITETDKGMLASGEIIFKLQDEYNGIMLKGSDMEIHTEGGLKGLRKSTSEEDCFLAILTLKESKEVGAIITDVKKITVDATVPKANIALELGGTAIDAYGKSIVIDNFLNIDSEESASNEEIGKETVKFTIGSNKYNKTGKEFSMDTEPYIETPGFTMVPIRYVAQAFGIEEKDLIFNQEQGIATIFAGKRIIQLKNGRKEAVVNGVQIEMKVPVIIKGGRTFVSVSEVAQLLGIKTSWDNNKKIATFQYSSNQE